MPRRICSYEKALSYLRFGGRVVSREHEVGVGLHTTVIDFGGTVFICFSMQPVLGKVA